MRFSICFHSDGKYATSDFTLHVAAQTKAKKAFFPSAQRDSTRTLSLCCFMYNCMGLDSRTFYYNGARTLTHCQIRGCFSIFDQQLRLSITYYGVYVCFVCSLAGSFVTLIWYFVTCRRRENFFLFTFNFFVCRRFHNARPNIRNVILVQGNN